MPSTSESGLTGNVTLRGAITKAAEDITLVIFDNVKTAAELDSLGDAFLHDMKKLMCDYLAEPNFTNDYVIGEILELGFGEDIKNDEVPATWVNAAKRKLDAILVQLSKDADVALASVSKGGAKKDPKSPNYDPKKAADIQHEMQLLSTTYDPSEWHPIDDLPEGDQALVLHPTQKVVDHLEHLMDTGLFGKNVREVAYNLICERLRQLVDEGWTT